MTAQGRLPGPYGRAARRYLASGWGSPLPLPPGRKKSPPDGWTGRAAPDASGADVEAWCEEHPDGNIGMRLCRGIIGIDVDAHKGERAAQAWQELTARYGPLPEQAPWCTSRDDGISGIRLFRVPDDYVAMGIMGPAGEVIQRHHRYVVVPPSVSPPSPAGTGKPYRWVGLENGHVPRRADLPILPTTWQNGLRAGTAETQAGGGSTWTDPDIDALATRGIPDGTNQDEYLRDLVFKLASQGISRAGIHAVWITAISRTRLTRPGQPWTDADFERHWRGAAAKTGTEEDTQARRLVLTPASQIEPEPVVWAWEDNGQGRIPSGSLGLFAGREGTGKSSLLIWLAARITTGTLPGSLGGPRAVIYVAVEDSWKYTIVPRLIAAGADLDLVYRAEVKETDDGTVSLSLPADSILLEQAITTRCIALVVLDPLMSAISDTLDTHVNRQVRQALEPLARMADRTGAVVAGIAHFNKSGGTDASSLITASGAFKEVARFIFAFAADDNDGSKVITQTKNNLGRSDLPSLAYRIIEAIVPTAKGDARVGRLVLDGETSRTVRDILSVQASGDTERSERTRADNFLRKALASGPRPTREVEEEAREAHQISKRTLERARTDLRIPSAKHGAIWWISLPEHEGDLMDTGLISAKSAKATSPGGDGGVGGVEP